MTLETFRQIYGLDDSPSPLDRSVLVMIDIQRDIATGGYRSPMLMRRRMRPGGCSISPGAKVCRSSILPMTPDQALPPLPAMVRIAISCLR
ncbi:MAG: hypothetical protein ABF752_06975 [Acetobacter fabarum]|uniref:hypothetical protein n=1 Tax=Acetobacter fabarum TaxID=483199 RepID=UPI0039E7F088